MKARILLLITLVLGLVCTKSSIATTGPTWSVNPASYSYNMSMLVRVNHGCEWLANPSNVIAAFVNGECRGTANTSNNNGSYFMASLSVFSNNVSGETIQFKVYNESTGETFDASTTVLFQNDAIYGYSSSPYGVYIDALPTDIDLTNASFDEHSNAGVLGKIGVDVSNTNEYNFSLISGVNSTHNNLFTIDGTNLNHIGNINYEDYVGNLSIRIKAEHANGCSVEKAINVTINDINEAPTGMSLSNTSVDENISLGTEIGLLSASSFDEDAQDSHTFILTDSAGVSFPDNNLVSLSANGLLTTNSELNYETKTKLNVHVQVTDAGGLTSSKSFTININNVNETPTNIILDNLTVVENLDEGTLVGTISVSDPDQTDIGNQVLSFADVPVNDHDKFVIVGNELKTLAKFDYETKKLYYLYITATDLNSLSVTKQIIVNVTNGNDKPTNVDLSNVEINEDAISGSVLGTFTSVDQDETDSYTYELVEGAGSTGNTAFIIAGDLLKTNQVFNYTEKNNYTIRVKTTDLQGAEFVKNFNINIINVNDAPTGVNLDNNTIVENSSASTFIGTCSTNDRDIIAGDSFTYSLANPYGNEGIDNDKISVTPTGDVRIKSAINFEEQATLNVRIKTTDAGGLTFNQGLTIEVLDQNDAPTNVALNNNSGVGENMPINTQITYFETTDEDEHNAALYSYELVNDPTFDNAFFTIVSNELFTKQVLDYETKSTYQIKVKATDPGGLAVTKALTVSVNDNNDDPIDISMSNASFFEAFAINTFIGKLSTTDQDAVDNFTYQLVEGEGSNGNAAFRLSNDSIFTNKLFNYNEQNVYSIRVKSSDKEAKTTEKAFEIHVKNSNNAPTNIAMDSYEVDENANIGTSVGVLASIDPDAGDGHRYYLVNGEGDTDNNKFEIIDNVLRTKAVFDYETLDTYSIRVKSEDFAGDSLQKSFVINIGDKNDVPSDMAISINEVSENLAIGSEVLVFNTIDQDANETFVYEFDQSIASDNDLFLISGDKLLTNYMFDYESKKIYTIRITVYDGAGNTLNRQFILNVTDANDAPVNIALSNALANENAGAYAFIGTFSTADEDLVDSFTYDFVSGIPGYDNSFFTISGDSLLLLASADFEFKNSYEVLVQSTDGGNASTIKAFSIAILDKNDAPTAMIISNYAVQENSGSNQVVGDLYTDDQDGGEIFNYELTNSLGTNDNQKFSLVGNRLFMLVNADFEGLSSYMVEVSVTDSKGAGLVKEFTVNVADINEAPKLEDQTFEIAENEMANTSIGEIMYTDVDANDMITLYLLNENGAKVLLTGSTLIANSTFNYEAQANYTFEVVAEDLGGMSDTATITIEVLDEIEANQSLPFNKMMSPNGDGKNDYFEIENVHIYKDFSFTIFDATGSVVHHVASQYDNSWDGTYNGNYVNKGSYYFILQSNQDSNTMFKGYFTILK